MKHQPDPTNPAAWKWKAVTFRRCLTLCEAEASAEKFIAKEFAGIYLTAWIHGREKIAYTDNPSKPRLISQKRAEAAEEACRALRRVITMRVCDQTEEDWSIALRRLERWIRLAGKRGSGPQESSRGVARRAPNWRP